MSNLLLQSSRFLALKAGRLTRLPPTQCSHTSRSLASLKRASTAMIAAFIKRFGSGEEDDAGRANAVFAYIGHPIRLRRLSRVARRLLPRSSRLWKYLGRAADAPASYAVLPHFEVAGLFDAPVHEVFIGLVWCATSGLCFHMTQPFLLSAISPVTLILDMRSWSVITVRSRTFSNTRVSSASVDGFEKKCSRFKVVSPTWHRNSVGTMPSVKTDDDDMVGEVVVDGGDVLDAPASDAVLPVFKIAIS